VALAAARGARSQPVLSVVIALIAAATVIVTLATAGRTVSTQRAVLARFDTLALTVLLITDEEGRAGLDAADVARVRRLSGVDWALGVGPVIDVRTAGLRGTPVSSRVIVGGSDLLDVDQPVDGQAYVARPSQAALGLVTTSGAVETVGGAQFPVVGRFQAAGPLAELEDSVLVVDQSYDGPLRRLYLHATNPDDLLNVAAAAVLAVGDRDGARPRVEVSADVAAIRSAVRGELGGASRATVLQALAAGLVLGALTIFSGVQARRRDFGRRRALGATRGQLLALVVTQVLLAAIPGCAVGAVVGSVVSRQLAGTWPGLAYPAAIAVLGTLMLALAALPPALVAAYRDPVAAIRVP
jgi:putative ABC transport system permease protein